MKNASETALFGFLMQRYMVNVPIYGKCAGFIPKIPFRRIGMMRLRSFRL